MARTTAATYAPTYRLRCETCGRDQRMASIKSLEIGRVIRNAPGGGNYGRCLFCKRSGLKVIDVV
jgi:hypothetical protein